jgi:probable rRNA maturation factor
MARLNRETFGRRGPTNVIAFPIDGPAPGDVRLPPDSKSPGKAPPPLLGEVVISLETVAREARQTGWKTGELFDFYLVHGILHLLGWDHDTPERAEEMDGKTWELMQVIGGGG